MTNKELSMKIREELKAAGIPKSAYSISVRWAGYERAIDVKVKDLSISLDRIENILVHYRHVDYDYHCMEILAGGNTFAHVTYDSDALCAASEVWRPRAAEILAADLPLFIGERVAEYSRNGHDYELVYFKGDNEMIVHKKGDTGWYGVRHYAGDVHSIACALAIFNACGKFSRYH